MYCKCKCNMQIIIILSRGFSVPVKWSWARWICPFSGRPDLPRDTQADHGPTVDLWTGLKPLTIFIKCYLLKLYKLSLPNISFYSFYLSQFESGILDICLQVLDENPKYISDAALDCSERKSSVYVTRVLSAMVSDNIIKSWRISHAFLWKLQKKCLIQWHLIYMF